MGTTSKLNARARVMNQSPPGIKNAHWQNMHWHEKPLPPTGSRRRMELEYQDSGWAGPASAAS